MSKKDKKKKLKKAAESRLGRLIRVSTSFVAWHRWKEAPSHREYLREYHRHVFGVKVSVCVSHNEREVEYHDLLDEVDEYIRENFEGVRCNHSCEAFAEKIFRHIESLGYDVDSVSVDEDGENTAIIYQEFEVLDNGPFGLALEHSADSYANVELPTEDTEEVQTDEGDETEKPGPKKKKKRNGPLPTDLVGKPFLGPEVEGPPTMVGINTLFIPANISRRWLRRILNALENTYPAVKDVPWLDAIYFGGGNDPYMLGIPTLDSYRNLNALRFCLHRLSLKHLQTGEYTDMPKLHVECSLAFIKSMHQKEGGHSNLHAAFRSEAMNEWSRHIWEGSANVTNTSHQRILFTDCGVPATLRTMTLLGVQTAKQVPASVSCFSGFMFNDDSVETMRIVEPSLPFEGQGRYFKRLSEFGSVLYLENLSLHGTILEQWTTDMDSDLYDGDRYMPLHLKSFATKEVEKHLQS